MGISAKKSPVSSDSNRPGLTRGLQTVFSAPCNISETCSEHIRYLIKRVGHGLKILPCIHVLTQWCICQMLWRLNNSFRGRQLRQSRRNETQPYLSDLRCGLPSRIDISQPHRHQTRLKTSSLGLDNNLTRPALIWCSLVATPGRDMTGGVLRYARGKRFKRYGVEKNDRTSTRATVNRVGRIKYGKLHPIWTGVGYKF